MSLGLNANIHHISKSVKKRKLLNGLFKYFCGLIALIPLSFLFVMLFTIFLNTYYALQQTKILVNLQDMKIDKTLSRHEVKSRLVNYLYGLLKREIHDLRITTIQKLVNNYAVHEILANTDKTEIWITANSVSDILYKRKKFYDEKIISKHPKLSKVLQYLENKGEIRTFFNYKIFINSDSRDSTQAGILGAFIGSLFTIFTVLIVSLPIGIMTALCIEELLQKSRFSYFFEINISNLSSVPPVIFGILGLAFYINFLGLPRSSSLTGGLTLAFMMFPIIVISTRQSINSVPISIKQAAFALGASPIEVISHHTLPLALPGIITGALLGIARILGESAPLLMIGMVAFIADIPRNLVEPASVFAVQIYTWSTNPNNAMIEKTSVLISILLILLLCLNIIAYITKRLLQKNFN